MNALGILRTLLALAVLAGANGGPALAQPVTITFSAQAPGSGLGGSDGIELAAESLVRFGYFSIPFDDVVAGLGAPSLLETAFIQLATTRVGYFGGETKLDGNGDVLDHSEDPNSPYEEAPGLFAHTVTYDPEALGLLTTRFYLWVVDTPEAENATEFGLFSDSDWFSPENTPGDTIYDVWTVDPNNPADLYHADRGPEESSVVSFGPLNKLRPLVSVPEPHLPALLLAAVSVLAWRRRRHHPLDL